MIKWRHVLLLSVMCFGLTASAQMRISVETDRVHYIIYEPVLVKVTLQNNSGNMLSFGSNPTGGEFVRVEVFNPRNEKLTMMPGETPDGHFIEPDSYLNAGPGLIIPAGVSKSVVVPIDNFYKLSDTGTYRVEVRVRHPRLQHDYVSSAVQFKLSEGMVTWERDIGLPGASSSEKIPMRHVSINMFQADQSQLYYLLIRDDDFVYTLKRLAPRVRGVEPQYDVDALSNIHFFVQTQPRVFSHFVFDLDGGQKQDAHYIVEEYLPIPRLIRDPDIGRVMVIGGRRAQDGIDFNDVSLPVMKAEEIPGATTEVRR